MKTIGPASESTTGPTVRTSLRECDRAKEPPDPAESRRLIRVMLSAQKLERMLTPPQIVVAPATSYSATPTIGGNLRATAAGGAKCERVRGTLAVLAAYGPEWPAWPTKQRQRRLAEVRALAVAVGAIEDAGVVS